MPVITEDPVPALKNTDSNVFRGHSAQISCPFCYTTHVFSHIIFYKYFIFNEKVG